MVLYPTSKKDTLYTGLYTIVTCIYLGGVSPLTYAVLTRTGGATGVTMASTSMRASTSL